MSAIFYHDNEQKKLAEASLKKSEANFKKPITTMILPAETFYNAEDYHQKYILQKHEWLMAALRLKRGEELVRSSLAARVNGYVGGYGDRDSFNFEKDDLGITEEVAEYILEQIEERQYG